MTQMFTRPKATTTLPCASQAPSGNVCRKSTNLEQKLKLLYFCYFLLESRPLRLLSGKADPKRGPHILTKPSNSSNKIAMEPLLFNEDNHLIGTRTGDGSHSTNQQPNTSSRRASPSPSTYPVQGYARTRILCSGYNVRLKTRKENKHAR